MKKTKKAKKQTRSRKDSGYVGTPINRHTGTPIDRVARPAHRTVAPIDNVPIPLDKVRTVA